MFLTLYFPLAAALSVRRLPEGFLDKLLEGNLNAARTQANRWTEEVHQRTDVPWLLQLYADMQMTLGIGDEAEEQYRRAQKAIRSPREAIRAASCRNVGWQALFRHRFATSLSCFARVVDETGIEPVQRLEARFGIACALYELGQSRDAFDALDELAAMAASPDEGGSAAWRDVLATLRFDVAVQRELRSSVLLSDHVYWQSGMTDERVAGSGDASVAADRQETEALRVQIPLLRERIGYLQQLRALMKGERDAMSDIGLHLTWAQNAGLHEYLRTTRFEIVLAALASDAPQLAEAMLEPLHRTDYAASTGHRQLEYLYCVAKVRQVQGRTLESMQLYSRYALITTQCLRDDAPAIAPFANRAARHAAQLDDVGARLPAKYRRAYRYLQENLDRHDLSVREVAAEVGVTERALQSAFKNFLGLSPTELIRRQRMERIRAELLQDSFTSDRSVLCAANKWGVQNRSTLVSGYRKQFHEAPSETLGR
ncbi:helix-turn-helix transcriptional regulator [Paraburkholderia fungorum]|uniref:AraC family transcriptional regulator n=1 Tax=Paraburkholderia fungorum TaxID=134537 RepID=A0A420FF21_9BURK|nr:helix-turn-helix transcriptional regulator [Paraburkholderia fungorum]RKF31445.1 AraC family transcriptional regulator [Paraburkholderia fungorum]